jgi:hypothetical protein
MIHALYVGNCDEVILIPNHKDAGGVCNSMSDDKCFGYIKNFGHTTYISQLQARYEKFIKSLESRFKVEFTPQNVECFEEIK